jgi:adenine-specific DNA-methyltransferase
MNTLNYIGSKHTLFDTLLFVCKENINDMETKTLMDLFAGTGTVGFNMLNHFKNCDANDLEYYSYVINDALLKCIYTENIQKKIDECNHLALVDGLIYNNFSPTSTCERMFFTNNNARKTDAIRQYIETLHKTSKITDNEFHFLLASLLVSIDKVANTSCVYGSYLKAYKASALKELILKPIHTRTELKEGNTVYNELAEKLMEMNSSKYYDVIYIDPPYNQRQYSANYSPLNYIAHYDENIVLKGKTALIDNYNKSNFCKKTEVKRAFTDLVNGANTHYLLISYNNEGLLSIEELKKILLKKGSVKLYKIQYNKFKAQQSVDKKFVEEYVWFVDTSKKGDSVLECNIDLIK